MICNEELQLDFLLLLLCIFTVLKTSVFFSGSTKICRREDQAGVESKCLDVSVQLVCLWSAEAS